jgi:hypothetical protein
MHSDISTQNGRGGAVNKAREGFDQLLAHYPDALPSYVQNTGAWLCVDLDIAQRFAIWIHTGNVYRVHGQFLGGEVAEDPFLIVTPL